MLDRPVRSPFVKLLPVETFTLSTADPLAIVLEKLSGHIEPTKPFRWFSRDHAPYQGTIDDAGFKITRIIHHRNSFLPVIRGQFESSSTGTIVRVNMRLHPFVMAFLAFWYATWYSISIPISLTMDLDPLMVWSFLGFPLIILFVFWGAFWYEAHRSRRELTAIVMGDIHSPQAAGILRLSNRHWRKFPLRFLFGAVWLAIVVWQVTAGNFSSFHSTPTTPPPPEATLCSLHPNQSPYCRLSPVRTLAGHTSVSAIAMSADSQTLVSGGQDKALYLWDLQTGALKQKLQSDSGQIEAIAIAPDGKTIVSGSSDRMVRIWSAAADWKPVILKGHTEEVRLVRITPDGKTAMSGSFGMLKVWDLATGQLKTTWPNTPNKEVKIGPLSIVDDGPSRFGILDISADGKTAILSFSSGKIAAWDLTTNQEKWVLKEKFGSNFLSATLSLDGKQAALQYGNAFKKFETQLKVWDLTTGEITAQGSLSFAKNTFISVPVAFSRDRIVGTTDGFLKVWNPQTAKLEAVLDSPWMRPIIVSPDGQHLVGVTGGSDPQIKVWKVG
jgi:WD40 repeat protein